MHGQGSQLCPRAHRGPGVAPASTGERAGDDARVTKTAQTRDGDPPCWTDGVACR